MNSPIINYSYPSTLSVSYKNDFEYRAFIRKLFEMANVSLISITEGLDPVSIDENQYDADAAQKMLDFIYAKTKDDARFQRIYLHAAGFMLSTDEEIGLVVEQVAYRFFKLRRHVDRAGNEFRSHA